MTVTLDTDPFATPEDTRLAPEIVTGGRYRLPNRDGSHKSGGWQRSSNLASAISDQKQLQNWAVRTALAGLASRPDLYSDLQHLMERVGLDKEAIKAAQAEILEIAEKAKDAAGGGYGRERGNRIHAIAEADWAGVPQQLAGRERELLRLFGTRLAEAQLAPIPGMQERIVLCEALEACGKYDSLARDLLTDLVHVIDTKTQRQFWSWQEVEAQLAIYAYSVAMWDPDAGCWVDHPHEIERTRGAALWVPDVDPLVVEIKPLDLERGWETAQLARRIVVQRSACKSARQEVSGRLWHEVRPVASVERYAKLLASVESRAEGSRLVAEIRSRGLWCPELDQVARRRLASL